MRGQLKSVGSLEEADVVIVEDSHSVTNNLFFDKVGYKRVSENGHTFPEDGVHFLVYANPRNRRQVERSVMTDENGVMQFDFR